MNMGLGFMVETGGVTGKRLDFQSEQKKREKKKRKEKTKGKKKKEGKKKRSHRGSNSGHENQNLVCYHYTMKPVIEKSYQILDCSVCSTFFLFRSLLGLLMLHLKFF